MNREALLERRTKAEEEFDNLEKQKAQIEARQSELRGQYQLLNEQIEILAKPSDATTIDVDKALEEKKNGRK